jgi:AcrR family transcriptional regulator
MAQHPRPLSASLAAPLGDVPEASEAPNRPVDRPVGEERRRQIVREAIRCFAAKGFRGTTIRDLATRVGITEAALYRYFPSKEALYAAIIDEKIAAPSATEAVQDAAVAGDDRAVFEGLARHLLANVEGDPSFLRILLYTGLEEHELAAQFFERQIHLREFVAGYIARRTREGAFRPVDPKLCARAFLGMVVDYLIVREVFNQKHLYPAGPEEVARTFVSIFLDGIRREPRALDG